MISTDASTGLQLPSGSQHSEEFIRYWILQISDNHWQCTLQTVGEPTFDQLLYGSTLGQSSLIFFTYNASPTLHGLDISLSLHSVDSVLELQLLENDLRMPIHGPLLDA